MPNLPNLTDRQLEDAIAQVSGVSLVDSGGQKIVFRCSVNEATYALKVALVSEWLESEEEAPTDAVAARARREVETMRECSSPHMVKLGPIGLTFERIAGQNVLYFTEEFIDGASLAQILRSDGPLAPADVVQLGLQITNAINPTFSPLL